VALLATVELDAFGDPEPAARPEGAPTHETWRCDGCHRSKSEGASPSFDDDPTKVHARLCTRCSQRQKRGSFLPLDAPPSPRGRNLTQRERLKARAAMRAYWERRVTDAAFKLIDLDTSAEGDAAFDAALVEFLAVVAYAGSYLTVRDYVQGSANVPPRASCSNRAAHHQP
jgi:hypothetical protein